MRPFRFGVNCTTASPAEWLDSARRAEALGFDVFIAQDHFANQLAPMAALAAAAMVTTRIRLATVVLDNDFRHPALVAKEAATLDGLSNGRFELGLGAGWLEADYEKTGIPLLRPSERMQRLRESAQICKALLSSTEPVSYVGEHYRIDNLEPMPRAVQQPRPPIMLGGRQQRMLSLAAEEADIVGISLLGQGASFEQKVASVRGAAGARFPHLDLHVNVSRVEVRDAAAEDDAPGALIGSVSQIAETLHERRERYGLNYYIIKGQAMDAFAPVLTRVR